MKRALDGEGREHEEYRLRLENERVLGMEAIKAREAVAEHKAGILGKALETADIDIVGGDGAFLDRIVNSVGMGKAVDEFVDRSDVVSDLAKDRTSTATSSIVDRPSVGAVKDSGLDAASLKDMTIGALLGQLVAGTKSGDDLEKLRKLQRQASGPRHRRRHRSSPCEHRPNRARRSSTGPTRWHP